MLKGLITDFKNLPRQILARELFYFFFVLFVALSLLETAFPNIVLVYFNLNYLFALLVITGLVALLKD